MIARATMLMNGRCKSTTSIIITWAAQWCLVQCPSSWDTWPCENPARPAPTAAAWARWPAWASTPCSPTPVWPCSAHWLPARNTTAFITYTRNTLCSQPTITTHRIQLTGNQQSLRCVYSSPYKIIHHTIHWACVQCSNRSISLQCVVLHCERYLLPLRRLQQITKSGSLRVVEGQQGHSAL